MMRIPPPQGRPQIVAVTWTPCNHVARGPFGNGYDMVLVSAICHMLGADENRDLLKRCFAALRRGGRVVVQDFTLNPAKTAPKAGALFSLNMLVGSQEGASYSEGFCLAGAGCSLTTAAVAAAGQRSVTTENTEDTEI